MTNGNVDANELPVPVALKRACDRSEAGRAWLEQLPHVVAEASRRWSLSLQAPYTDVTASWVAPVSRLDGSPAVLKIGLPHFEAEQEIHGLRFWDGRSIVHLLESDTHTNVLLLERCIPGTQLRDVPEDEQDAVIADILRALWREPELRPFRPLSELLDYWIQHTNDQAEHWQDRPLVREGLALLSELSRNSTSSVTLATDLHAGNVLRAERSAWLAIDPKPFFGDPTYDATQHLFNCPSRMKSAPHETIARCAGLLGLDARRLQLWMFARAAAQPRQKWTDDPWLDVARSISP